MKKTISFVMALVLVFGLMSISAMAANSPVTEPAVAAQGIEATVVESAVLDAEVAAAAAAATASEYFGTEVEGEITEMMAVEVGAVANGPVEVTITPATAVAADAKVTVMIGIPGANGIVWTAVEATVVNGEIVVEIPAELAQQMANTEVLVATVVA